MIMEQYPIFEAICAFCVGYTIGDFIIAIIKHLTK